MSKIIYIAYIGCQKRRKWQLKIQNGKAVSGRRERVQKHGSRQLFTMQLRDIRKLCALFVLPQLEHRPNFMSVVLPHLYVTYTYVRHGVLAGFRVTIGTAGETPRPCSACWRKRGRSALHWLHRDISVSGSIRRYSNKINICKLNRTDYKLSQMTTWSHCK